MSQLSGEQQLIDLWRQGDQQAAKQIVDGYVDRLVVLARRHLHQRLAARIDPEDIVQSVFRTFFSRVRDGQFVFAEQDDLTKLLVRITLNKTLRHVAFHRAAKRNPGAEATKDDGPLDRINGLLVRSPAPKPRLRSSINSSTCSTSSSRRNAKSLSCACRATPTRRSLRNWASMTARSAA